MGSRSHSRTHPTPARSAPRPARAPAGWRSTSSAARSSRSAASPAAPAPRRSRSRSRARPRARARRRCCSPSRRGSAAASPCSPGTPRRAPLAALARAIADDQRSSRHVRRARAGLRLIAADAARHERGAEPDASRAARQARAAHGLVDRRLRHRLDRRRRRPRAAPRTSSGRCPRPRPGSRARAALLDSDVVPRARALARGARRHRAIARRPSVSVRALRRLARQRCDRLVLIAHDRGLATRRRRHGGEHAHARTHRARPDPAGASRERRRTPRPTPIVGRRRRGLCCARRRRRRRRRGARGRGRPALGDDARRALRFGFGGVERSPGEVARHRAAQRAGSPPARCCARSSCPRLGADGPAARRRAARGAARPQRRRSSASRSAPTARA